MNRTAIAPLVLLPLMAVQEPRVPDAPGVEWHSLAKANALALETGKPLLIVFR